MDLPFHCETKKWNRILFHFAYCTFSTRAELINKCRAKWLLPRKWNWNRFFGNWFCSGSLIGVSRSQTHTKSATHIYTATPKADRNWTANKKFIRIHYSHRFRLAGVGCSFVCMYALAYIHGVLIINVRQKQCLTLTNNQLFQIGNLINCSKISPMKWVHT